jgi:hypothetical protein
VAGYRRTRGDRPKWAKRLDRRRDALLVGLATAETNAMKIAVAVDFLRGAIESAQPAVADRETAAVVAALTEAGTRCLTPERGSGR